MTSTFYITTPIYYVNARPHLGHAYSTIVADTIRRFHVLKGEETWFLTGTDEHGDKIAKAAEAADKTPQTFVDDVSRQFQALWPRLGIQNDQFIRTTDADHVATVQRFLQRVYDNGDIYFGEHSGHYCTGCERFYTEKELENGLCPQHQIRPEFIREKNYFFKMSKYLPWLAEYIRDNPDFIRPERYRNEALAMIESGVLEDLCISRPKSRLQWGIELPFDRDYVCYVWFDALVNYVSALGWPDGERYAHFWPGEHLVAKDILKPHGVFWPTMLKAAGLPLYRHLNVHGYWLIKETKMSKSLGNVVDPAQMAERYGLDAFRYFLLRDMQFGSDASFSEEALITRFNADLANDLGNLFSRVLSMNARYFSGKIPEAGTMEQSERDLIDLAENVLTNYAQLFENMRFSQALDALWDLVRALNRYVDTQVPWVLFKQGNTARLGTVIRIMLEGMRKVALCLWPVMPGMGAKLMEQLGQPLPKSERFGQAPGCNPMQEAGQWQLLTTGAQAAASSSLFPRVEKPQSDKTQSTASKQAAQAQKTKTSASVESAAAAATFDDFQKLDLRVGTVLACTRVPKADKLLCFSIDLGEAAPRQILSGIAEFFVPNDLVGKQVCVVANLAPRKIRGMVSAGMILTAESGGRLMLIVPAGHIEPGSKIA